MDLATMIEAASIPSTFPSRSKRPGRMGRAISCSRPSNYWRSWRLWYPGRRTCR